MNNLERRYRWLLKAYPRPYREYRTDEILEIVLAGVDEQQPRPSLRESWALVVGGLRARTGVDRLDAQALRHSALRLSALALLIYGITRWAGFPISALVSYIQFGTWPNDGGSPIIAPWLLVGPMPAAIALFAAAGGAYRPAFVMSVLTVVVQCWPIILRTPDWSAESFSYMWNSQYWPALLTSLALLPLLRAPRTPVKRPWVWPLLGVLAVVTLTANPLNGWLDAPTMSLYAFAVLAVIAAPIDARMPIVAFALLLVPALARIVYNALFFESAARNFHISATTILILVVLMAATLTAATIASRRQARL
ncbi:hypothetical protein ACLQ29_32150 [Micromonospora sp. DT228]|uniref:hypothetical protein n=1 Tax=Micromonospora sp. DT228 TaxID=3393443 RepID=UPI003CEA127B